MQHLIESSRILQTAVELSPSASLIATPRGEIVLVNRALERQSGYARDELVGQPLELLVPDGPPPIGADLAAIRGRTVLGTDRELVARRKDGSAYPVELELRPIPTHDGFLVLASVDDISGRRHREAAQHAALQEQLEFERVVAELSFQFINLPDDKVNEAIRNGLERTCQHLGLDRGSFCSLGPDGEIADRITFAAGGTPRAETLPTTREQFPWVFERVVAGDVMSFSTITEIPSDIDRATYSAAGIKSAAVVPLAVDGRVVGAVGFSTVWLERTWPPEVLHRLKVIGSVFDQVLARQRRQEAVRAAYREVERLKDQLQVENVYLRREERERLGTTHVVGQSPALRGVLEQIRQVAPTDATVLLLGETGTGKEMFAAYIHELGPRHARPMVRVNCAAIPATLIESELFGREKGAFTGALARQMGRFELADHSTIFLDEVGDLPLDVQVKLLRVLEERTIERLGSARPIAINVRIIAATHRNLEQRTGAGAFREDLYYRLNVFPIEVPPLRARVEDIPLLLWRFVEEFSKTFGKRITSIDDESLAALQQYEWPGNIRELRNVVERAMILTTSQRLTITPPPAPTATVRSPKLIEVEKEHIRAVLESTGWRIRGTGGAADRLGMKPTTLETRIVKLGLKRPGHR